MRTVSVARLAIIATSLLAERAAYNTKHAGYSRYRHGTSMYTKAPYADKNKKRRLRKIAHASRMRNR